MKKIKNFKYPDDRFTKHLKRDGRDDGNRTTGDETVSTRRVYDVCANANKPDVRSSSNRRFLGIGGKHVVPRRGRPSCYGERCIRPAGLGDPIIIIFMSGNSGIVAP